MLYCVDLVRTDVPHSHCCEKLKSYMIHISLKIPTLNLKNIIFKTNLLHQPLCGLLYRRRMMDDDGCGAVGGMSGKGNQSTWRKLAPVPLCPP
jgi:hypothetical protein